jgi:hypothetical protein
MDSGHRCLRRGSLRRRDADKAQTLPTSPGQSLDRESRRRAGAEPDDLAREAQRLTNAASKCTDIRDRVYHSTYWQLGDGRISKACKSAVTVTASASTVT